MQKSTNKERENYQNKAKPDCLQQKSSTAQELHPTQKQNNQQKPPQSRQTEKPAKMSLGNPQHNQADTPGCSRTLSNNSKDIEQADNNATLLILMYELSRHMKEIAHLISYSNFSQLQHVSSTLFHLGNTIFGESFSDRLKQ